MGVICKDTFFSCYEIGNTNKGNLYNDIEIRKRNFKLSNSNISDKFNMKHMEESETKEKNRNELVIDQNSYNQLMFYIDNITKIQNAFLKYYYKKRAKLHQQKQTFQPSILNTNSEKNDNNSSFNENIVENDSILKRPNTLGINKYLQTKDKKSIEESESDEDIEIVSIESSMYKKAFNQKKTLEKPQPKRSSIASIMSPKQEIKCTKYIIKNIILNNQTQMYTKIFTNSKNDEENISEINFLKKPEDIHGYFLKKSNKKIRFFGKLDEKTKTKDGFGIVKWTDKSQIEGIFSQNHLNGYCKFYNSKTNSNFHGIYKNNIPNGFGIYFNSTLTLHGYWEKENLNGIGLEVWQDDTYYQGEFLNSKKNGIGLYRWSDGTIYQGEFINNQMNGYGLILYSNDRIYAGEILNGFMNGYGVYIWENGNKYMGYYLQDTKHGFGVFIWNHKPFVGYFGFWEMGKQHGVGAKVNGNNIKYGLWNRGKINLLFKGVYEIDRYLSGLQMRYYKFFLPSYINKIKSLNS